MKPPAKYRQELATVGELVLRGTTTQAAARARLLKTARREKGFAARVLADYVDRSLKRWLGDHGERPEEEVAGQLLLGLDLPRQLEVSPNRFKPVGDMTRGDWAAARRQARTKADNAAGYADLLDRAWAAVEHLLTDDELTTAQALGRAA